MCCISEPGLAAGVSPRKSLTRYESPFTCEHTSHNKHTNERDDPDLVNRAVSGHVAEVQHSAVGGAHKGSRGVDSPRAVSQRPAKERLQVRIRLQIGIARLESQ